MSLSDFFKEFGEGHKCWHLFLTGFFIVKSREIAGSASHVGHVFPMPPCRRSLPSHLKITQDFPKQFLQVPNRFDKRSSSGWSSRKPKHSREAYWTHPCSSIFVATATTNYRVWDLMPRGNGSDSSESQKSSGPMIPSTKRVHIPPNGKRKIILKSTFKRGYVSFRECLIPWISSAKSKLWMIFGNNKGLGNHQNMVLKWTFSLGQIREHSRAVMWIPMLIPWMYVAMDVVMQCSVM